MTAKILTGGKLYLDGAEIARGPSAFVLDECPIPDVIQPGAVLVIPHDARIEYLALAHADGAWCAPPAQGVTDSFTQELDQPGDRTS